MPEWIKLIRPIDESIEVNEWVDNSDDSYGEDDLIRELNMSFYIVERHGEKYYWTDLGSGETFTTCEYPNPYEIEEVPLSQLSNNLNKAMKQYELRKEFFSHVVKNVNKNVNTFKEELALA